jgi:hypothetical protein
LCSLRSFSSSDDSSKPGRGEAGTRAVDAAKRICVVVLRACLVRFMLLSLAA